MRSRLVIATATAAAVAATVTIAVQPVGAATVRSFFGYAGGSQVRVADATISSDLSVQSVVKTADTNASDTKHTVNLKAAGLLTAAAVSTSAAVKSVSGGRQVVTTTHSTGVNLLSGAITLDAITSTSTAAIVNGTPTANSVSKFAGLHIAGVTLPVTIPQNYTVTIPNVATVIINYSQANAAGDIGASFGSGLVVTLLGGQGANPAGSTVYLAPTFAAAASGEVPARTGHGAGGLAYGTEVAAKVGSTLAVTSDPTAPTTVPFGGTGGKKIGLAVAGVNVPSVITAGVVRTSTIATNTTAGAAVRTDATLAGISLFGGLISAGAISSEAHAHTVHGTTVVVSGASTIANLVIAGKAIPLNVKPNTTITVANLGKVVLNEQTRVANTIVVRALHITLSTAAYGLSAGAQIQVAYTSAAAS